MMPNYSVIEKEVGDMKVVSIREILPTYTAVGTQMNQFCQYFENNKVQPAGAPFAIYHDLEYKEANIDIECVFPIVGEAKEYDKFKVSSLKGGKFASTIHTGSFENVSDAYKAVFGWAEANGYKVIGPCREVYLETPRDGKGMFVTEIQMPIGK
jgi:effector-binding domain-containing protein